MTATGIKSPRSASFAVGDARGSEHLTPCDTMDQDYGDLLERVCGEGLASPTGLEAMWTPEVPIVGYALRLSA